ncbi:MAG TPA: glycosyltransferase [Mucilaginibacter sp.]|nr:glycosyltransferase [Mucilaginibacter sp.]
MIFVTIGTQLPFDRLIKAVDQLASEMKETEFIAQTIKGHYQPKYMKTVYDLSPTKFTELSKKAQIIISHAGMGTILSALMVEKPILVMPRLLKHKEIRSDHQIATANTLEDLRYINVAYSTAELKSKVRDMINNPAPLHKIGNFASDELIKSITEFLDKSKK